AVPARRHSVHSTPAPNSLPAPSSTGSMAEAADSAAPSPPLRDRERASIAWRDLLPLGRGEAIKEVLLPLPWLGGSLTFAAYELSPAALAFSFVFFLTGLRLNHGGCHHAIGLGRHATDGVLLVLSALMLGSMHAVRWNHLRHHRHCLEPNDIE